MKDYLEQAKTIATQSPGTAKSKVTKMWSGYDALTSEQRSTLQNQALHHPAVLAYQARIHKNLR